MNKVLPSKKFLLIIALLIIVLFLLTILNVDLVPKRKVATSERTPTEGSAQALLAKEAPLVDNDNESQVTNDADGDGLLDWEELLWGTNPIKADTDGNGISDGDEVAIIQERLQGDLEGLESVAAYNSNLSRTDVIARDSFTAFQTLNRVKELQGEDYELLSQSTVEQIYKNIDIKLLKVSDLRTVSNSSRNINNYLVSVDGMFGDNALTVDDIEAFNGYVSEGFETGQYITRANQALASQQLLVNKLRNLRVPLRAVDAHLSLINKINAFIGIGNYILNPTGEPLLSYAALFEYKETMTSLIKAYSSFLDLTNDLTKEIS